MDFNDQIKQFSNRIETIKDSLQTEEATKTSIIMPFFALLGYDVFNPEEFVPEFTADVGIKKGEKVDYAIFNDGEPVILIECKWIGEPLEKHDSQLFRYFGVSEAKFAILTNGQYFRFFTDLEEPNKMDKTPFLDINILDIKENQINELKKFHKSQFNLDEILDVASELKYSNQFKQILATQLQQPSDDFIKLFLANTYTGRFTQVVIDKFRPILKKSLNNYISELMSDKIKAALDVNAKPNEETQVTDVTDTESSPISSKIITTNEELEAYFIVKNLLKNTCSIDDILYKDTESYFAILYKGKVTKWICRLFLTETRKTLIISDDNKKEIKYQINDIYEIENYTNELIDALKKYL